MAKKKTGGFQLAVWLGRCFANAIGAIAGAVVWIVVTVIGRVILALPSPRAIRALGRTIQCPMGCPAMRADGFGLCPKCHGRSFNFVFAPCSGCGHIAGHTPCIHCGHLIINETLE